MWYSHAGCGVQSAPCHIHTNLTRTDPLVSCWPQIGRFTGPELGKVPASNKKMM